MTLLDSPRGKGAFYSRADVAESYDEQRFGGPSGARVNAREVRITLDMVPSVGRLLDLACGTGRLARAVADRGQPVIALDFSPSMAARALTMGIRTVIADGFSAPFAGGSFDAVVALRFAFHYADLVPLLAEMRRVAKPGAVLVFDTYSWSPRARVPVGGQSWGGRVYLHPRREVAEVATRLGLHIDRLSPCFLFSPYLYRLAPPPLVRAFEYLERRVPSTWLCRIFWKLSV